MPTVFATKFAFSVAQKLFQNTGAYPSGTGFYLALSTTEIANTDQHVVSLADFTTFTEVNTYTRVHLTGPNVQEDSVLHRWFMTFTQANADFGTPLDSTTIKAMLLYFGISASSGDDGSAYVVGWWQGLSVPQFPFDAHTGTASLVIPLPAAGLVFGPNAP